jgi:hypothetical protein
VIPAQPATSTTGPTADLLALQRSAFDYFLAEANPRNGLIRDADQPGSPCSIAAVGLGLSAYTVGVHRGYIRRADAVERVLTTLRFFRNSPQGPEANATGFHGFYYHFLDMETGRRTWRSELSTIDTALLVAGMLSCAAYFDGHVADEREIRRTAEELYARVDWNWARAGGPAVALGWRPGRGFMPYHWTGYSEALLLYILGLGSPTHPLPESSYDTWLSTYRWKRLYGYELVFGGPLFVHQLPQVWIDLRGIQDSYMRSRGIDYFENSRRATYVQREYAIRNPKGHAGYGANLWGFSACDGPGQTVLCADGEQRRYFDYHGRGIPWGVDDGTIAPWAVLTSLPFAPEIVLPALESLRERYPQLERVHGCKCSFSATCGDTGDSDVWVSEVCRGLDQGPIVMMIENHLTGWFWQLMKRSEPVVQGLRRAGFAGGWLEE